MCIIVIDAEKIGQSWSTYTLFRRYKMSTLDEITKEKQRVSEALARVNAQRETLTGQLSELEATERVLARYSKSTRAKKDGLSQVADHGNKRGRSSAASRAPANCARKTSWRQTHLADPRRASPCLSNRQDAAGNHRCMQGRSSKPCRRGDCSAQARWPDRRARWEALRHIVDGDRATISEASDCLWPGPKLRSVRPGNAAIGA